MSQHADILTNQVMKGVARGQASAELILDVQSLLECLGYDESFTDIKVVTKHVHDHTVLMATQKDGLHGVPNTVLSRFAADIRVNNPWLS